MGLFKVFLTGRAEHVDFVEMPKEGEWHFKIRCSSCGELFPKEVGVSQLESVEMNKMRKATVILRWHCQFRSQMQELRKEGLYHH